MVAAAGLLIAPAGRARAQIAVDELELRLTRDAMATSYPTQSFRVTNPGSEPAHVTISVQDWDRSESGENRYYPASTMPYSCGQRLAVFPRTLQLAPHASAAVRVTVDSAAAIAHSCTSILFVEAPPLPARNGGAALTYTIRYGVKVYVEPPGTQPGGDIDDMTFDSTGVARLHFINTGSRQSEVRGRLEVRRLDNSVAASVTVSEFPVLPDAKRWVSVDVPRLPAGRYILLGILDYGGTDLAASQLDVVIP